MSVAIVAMVNHTYIDENSNGEIVDDECPDVNYTTVVSESIQFILVLSDHTSIRQFHLTALQLTIIFFKKNFCTSISQNTGFNRLIRLLVDLISIAPAIRKYA